MVITKDIIKLQNGVLSQKPIRNFSMIIHTTIYAKLKQFKGSYFDGLTYEL